MGATMEVTMRYRVIAVHRNGFHGFAGETDSEGVAVSTAFAYNRGDNPDVDRFIVVNTETGEKSHVSRLIAGGDF